MKPAMFKAFMPRFGLSFKVVSGEDTERGKPVAGSKPPSREILRQRMIANTLQEELGSRFRQIWKANTLNLSQADRRGEYVLSVVEDEPFYPTTLLGDDSYLYRALGKVSQTIREKTLSYGILRNLTSAEETKVLNALSNAQNQLVKGLERSRLDIVI